MQQFIIIHPKTGEILGKVSESSLELLHESLRMVMLKSLRCFDFEQSKQIEQEYKEIADILRNIDRAKWEVIK